MKTTFRRKFSTGPSSRRRFFYIALTLGLGILFFIIFRSPIFSALSQVWRSENVISIGVRDAFSMLRSKDSLILENNTLKSELQNLNGVEESLRTLQDVQNEMLAQFGRATTTKFIAAGVLAHPPQTLFDVLIIDAGSNDGVKVGDKVSQPQGGALGVVTEVSSNQSKAELYSASGIQTPAFLERNNLAVTLLGTGGGSFKLSLPRDTAVQVGDRILTPGLKGELVAVVEEINIEPTDSSKTVILRGVANVSSIRFVEIH